MAYRINVPYNGMTLDNCAQRVRITFYNLGWSYHEGPGFIKASVPLSLLSWGEEVMVCFYQMGFSIESRCVFPLQFIDWGKNKNNVNKFMNIFQQIY